MYRAQIVEAGAIEGVVNAPQHPYTQLLISAIPRAETGRQWLASEEDGRREAAAVSDAGCCFADRCPQVAAGCLTGLPALRRTEPRRAVACVQYREHPGMPADALGEVLSL